MRQPPIYGGGFSRRAGGDSTRTGNTPLSKSDLNND